MSAESNLKTLQRAAQIVNLAADLGIGNDVDSGISDIICDLMHLQQCWHYAGLTDVEGVDAADQAEYHFIAEKIGDDISDGPFIYPGKGIFNA